MSDDAISAVRKALEAGPIAWYVAGDIGPVFKPDAAFTDQTEAEHWHMQQDYPQPIIPLCEFDPEAIRALLAELDAARAALATSAETLTNIATDVIDGYKAGLAGQPMGFVGAAFDCGWITGNHERAQQPVAAAPMPPLPMAKDTAETGCWPAYTADQMHAYARTYAEQLEKEVERKADYAERMDALAEQRLIDANALRADAERYRWLREKALIVDMVADPDNFVQVWTGTDPAFGEVCFRGRTLDAAIDAASASLKDYTP